MSTWKDEFFARVDRSIAKGGNSGSGSDVPGWIDHAVYRYMKRITAGARPVKITSLRDYIFNKVLEAKRAVVTNAPERLFGTLLVTSSDMGVGWLQEEQKVVSFESLMSVYMGEVVPYRLVRGKYIIDKAFTGSSYGKGNMAYGASPNILARIGEGAGLYKYTENTLDTSLVSFDYGGQSEVPAAEQIWWIDEGTYCYFDGTNYRETSEPIAGTGDINISCAAQMPSITGNTAFTHNLIDYTVFAPGPPKVVKILPYGPHRIVLLGYYYATENDAQYADWYELGLFEMLLINTVTENVTKLGVTHSNWTSKRCHNGMYAGYVDVQINKENGLLLVLESASSPTVGSFAAKFYSKIPTYDTEEPPNITNADDPQVFKFNTNVDVYQVPFDLVEYSLSNDGTTLTPQRTIYTHDGVVSSIDGVSVTGGVTSTMFTQQPESFEFFFNRHVNVYHQSAILPTVEAEVIAGYKVLCYGRWEFYDLTGDTIHYNSHSTASGEITSTHFVDGEGTTLQRPSYDNEDAGFRYLDTDRQTVCERTSATPGVWTDVHPPWTIAITPNYTPEERIQFIVEFIPATNRLTVDSVMMFYEHLGGCWSGKPSSETSYSTFSGTSAINLTYPSAEGSHLQENRFLALTDGVAKKFLWAARVHMLFTWTDNDPLPNTVHYSSGYEQGYYFFKNDIEPYEMPLLGGEGIDKSERWNGGFVSKDDATLIEYTYGLNNTGAAQIRDSEVICVVSRAERIDFLNAADWTTRSPSVVNYDAYVLYFRVAEGGLAGIVFPGQEPIITHDLVEIIYLPQFNTIKALSDSLFT